MLTRPPLNAREPRTLQDVARDPWDYIEHHRAPEDFSHDLGRDRDDLAPFRGILFALAVVLGALAWVFA